jgi:hypothetical protein
MERTIKDVDHRFKELCQTDISGGEIHDILVNEFGFDLVKKHTEWQLEQMRVNDTPASKSGHVSHQKTRIEDE